MRTLLVRSLSSLPLILLSFTLAIGQEPPPAPPPPAPTPPEPTPPVEPIPPDAPEAPEPPEPTGDAPAGQTLQAGKAGLRVHIITTRNTFEPLVFDLINVGTGEVATTGRGV